MGDDIAVSTTHVVPVGQPLPGASLGQATKRFFRGYFRFSGRASLSEFWWAMLAVWLISLVPLVPTMLLANTMNGWSQPGGAALLTPEEAQVTLYSFFGLAGASMLASVVMTIPTYAVMWRRVQDANFHGAWILISFIGLGIVPFIMCLLPSNPAGARSAVRHAGRLSRGPALRRAASNAAGIALRLGAGGAARATAVRFAAARAAAVRRARLRRRRLRRHPLRPAGARPPAGRMAGLTPPRARRPGSAA